MLICVIKSGCCEVIDIDWTVSLGYLLLFDVGITEQTGAICDVLRL